MTVKARHGCLYWQRLCLLAIVGTLFNLQPLDVNFSYAKTARWRVAEGNDRFPLLLEFSWAASSGWLPLPSPDSGPLRALEIPSWNTHGNGVVEPGPVWLRSRIARDMQAEASTGHGINIRTWGGNEGRGKERLHRDFRGNTSPQGRRKRFIHSNVHQYRLQRRHGLGQLELWLTNVHTRAVLYVT